MTGRDRERAFTDSELSSRLIPCVIIGILMAIAIPNFRAFRAQANATKDVDAIEAAERAHRNANGTWLEFRHAYGEADTRIDELSFDVQGSYDIDAIAEAGSNGALVLRASGGRLKKPIERRVSP